MLPKKLASDATSEPSIFFRGGEPSVAISTQCSLRSKQATKQYELMNTLLVEVTGRLSASCH